MSGSAYRYADGRYHALGTMQQLVAAAPRGDGLDVFMETQDYEIVHRGHMTDFVAAGVPPAQGFVWIVTQNPDRCVAQACGPVTDG